MKIALIGFMGSGKSTVGRVLSARIGMRCLELDELLLKGSGFDSIPDVFAKIGEAGFRELERKALLRALSEGKCIISCGGGIITRDDNIAILKAQDIIKIYLKATFSLIQKRIGHDNNRPLFKDLDKARLLYEAREPVYSKLADLTIEVEHLDATEIANTIMKYVGK